jgi:hypothetical protein
MALPPGRKDLPGVYHRSGLVFFSRVPKNCPLPTPQDRLFFLLTYLKTYSLQVVQGRLFGMGQSKANQWRLLLDSRVVDLRMSYTPIFVTISSLKPLFFNGLKTLLSAKFERLDDLESRFQADLDNICETFNVERRSIKFEKWRTTP